MVIQYLVTEIYQVKIDISADIMRDTYKQAVQL